MLIFINYHGRQIIMKKRIVAALLVAAMSLSLLTGCHDSGNSSNVAQVDYDPAEEVKDFESVLIGFMHIKNVEIYVTGSNSKMLSSDILTEFRGRSDEIRVHPLSFAEYYAFVGGDKADAFEEYAFYDCKALYDIYCYAKMPPAISESSFVNYNAYVHVPCDSKRYYQADMAWSLFPNIQCIESDEVKTDGVVVTPSTNDVTIIWPTSDSADTYTIIIKQGNDVFCTLTFNADGQLLNIAFAPSRDGDNRPAQYAEQAVNGYRFTVTGLTEATQYAYSVTTKDAANQTIVTYSGEFTTMGGTTSAVEDILQNTTNCQKILRDGQLIIVRDGIEYNAMGQEL